MLPNNISYNYVHDKRYPEKKEMLCFYRLESGQNFDIQHNTFAHNENSYYLVNYINYYSSKIMSSAFINNTVRSDLIFLTQTNSNDNTIFTINHCTFYSNYETDTTSLVDIIGGHVLNLKVTIILYQIDSLLPSTNLYSNYYYITGGKVNYIKNEE